jgi:uncharacterized protein YkwD
MARQRIRSTGVIAALLDADQAVGPRAAAGIWPRTNAFVERGHAEPVPSPDRGAAEYGCFGNLEAAPAIRWVVDPLWSRAVCRCAFLIVAASLTLGFVGTARAADEADRSMLEGYASWATGALVSLPEGVQLLPPLAERLAELTSQRRREAGLEPLEADPELLPAAQAHALDVLERGYLDHVTPGGLDPAERVALLHRRLVGRVGENLAEQQGLAAKQLAGQIGLLAAKIVDGWMQSPGHRENILDGDYTHLEIAAAARDDAVVVVQLFEARQALLAEPLPLHISQDATVALEFEQGLGLAVPAQYAYARPDQPAKELVTLDLSIGEVPVEPGTYVLKFLFPSGQAGRFEVVGGPAIFVQ